MTYVVEMVPDGPIKIGRTTNLDRRVRAITAHNPYARFVSTLPIAEKMVHRVLRAHRLRGEWFRRDPAVLEFLKGYGLLFAVSKVA